MKAIKQVLVACALIHRERGGSHEVFVARRAATKKFLPNVFELPGGHVELGEEPVDALKRELIEEFDLEISVGDPFTVITYVDGAGEQAGEIIYFATLMNPDVQIEVHPEDHSEYRWVSLDTLPSIASDMKPLNDEEFVALRRGLELLGGAPLNLG